MNALNGRPGSKTRWRAPRSPARRTTLRLVVWKTSRGTDGRETGPDSGWSPGRTFPYRKRGIEGFREKNSARQCITHAFGFRPIDTTSHPASAQWARWSGEFIDDHQVGGGQTPLSIDLAQAELWFGAEPVSGETPERIFERRWALAVLDRALGLLREECETTGRARQFDALAPFLSREPADGEYDTVAATLGMNIRAVAVAVHRLRAQYRATVRAEVAAGINDPTRIDEELRHLAAAL